MTSTTGKTTAESNPFEIFVLSPESRPTAVGPPVQPRSPRSAYAANTAEEIFGINLLLRENVAGHIGETARPQRQQPIRATMGFDDRDASR